jgi:hypothetical protein
MNKLNPTTKRLLTFILIFAFITMLGFVPWEPLLSIQIRNNVLIFFTSSLGELVGLFGLILTLLVYLERYKHITILKVLLAGSLMFIILFFVTELLMPAFDWKDKSVYRSGNDYLVVQEFDGFVTTSIKNPRVVRTTSPYGMVRLVEEQFNLADNDNRFDGNTIIYEGKTWHKEKFQKK